MIAHRPCGTPMRIALITCLDLNGVHGDDQPLADELARRGHKVHAVPWNRPGVRWQEFDLALLRSMWDYVEQTGTFLEWLHRADCTTRLWNPASVVAWNLDKRYLLDLDARGVPIVETVLAVGGSSGRLESVLDSRGWEEVVIKPAIDLGGEGAFRVGRGNVATGQRQLDDLLGAGPAVIQPFLASVLTAGERSLVFIAGRFSHAVRKVPGAGEFRVQTAWGGHAEVAEADADDLRVAGAALRALGRPVLYARADLLRDEEEKPRLLELELIDPRLYLRFSGWAQVALADAIETL